MAVHRNENTKHHIIQRYTQPQPLSTYTYSILAHLVLAKPNNRAVAWIGVSVASLPSLNVRLGLAGVEQAVQLPKAGWLRSKSLHFLLLKVCTLGAGSQPHSTCIDCKLSSLKRVCDDINDYCCRANAPCMLEFFSRFTNLIC